MHIRRKTAAVTWVAMLVVTACRGESAHEARAADAAAAQRLTGLWEISLRLERPMSLADNINSLPRTVTGTVAFNEYHDAPLPQMPGATHTGVYDIRLDSLGALSLPQGMVPSVVAQAGPVVHVKDVGSDSVYIVMNPETPQRIVRLAGRLDGDSVRGTWTTASLLGGGGTFALRRRVAELRTRAVP